MAVFARLFFLSLVVGTCCSWVTTTLPATTIQKTTARHRRMSSEWNENDGMDSNLWRSSDDDIKPRDQADWQETLSQKQDGSFWSSFEPSQEETLAEMEATASDVTEVKDDAEVWLETLAEISAEEVQFNLKEADRADKARQMEEWGFDKEVIANSLSVAVDTTLEDSDQLEGMKKYREKVYAEDIDLSTVESHTTVEVDDETGEPVRSQMVYVDEHTCIGCTNCAMIAQSTFYMNSEHGRARVFQQWGDDDETIQVAIETCPVDCIHYVPYDELKSLEIERRDQNINFKARLVSQAEDGNSGSHMVGGASRFTAPQKISGNMGSRCNNCPTNGCKNCPMFGVGKNPEFERKEKLRKERRAKKLLQLKRETEQKSAEL